LHETKKRQNVKLYNHYINEAAKRKSLALAKNLFSQLQEQSLQPNEFTYTCMINACSRTFCLEEAESYLRKMQAANLKPNEITWTAIIKGATAVFDLHKAKSFLQEMIQGGVSPNTRTFNTILRACFRTGETSLALEMQSQMKKLSIKSDTSTLQSLTQIQAQSMMLNEATDTLNQLEAMIQQKEMENIGSFYYIDPSLYLLMASVSILNGVPLKRSKAFMNKYEESVAKLEKKPVVFKKKEEEEVDHVENGEKIAATSKISTSHDGGKPSSSSSEKTVDPIIAPEMVMESSYLRSIIDKDEGFPKSLTQFTKLGPRKSNFVLQKSSSSSSSSSHFTWHVDESKVGKIKRKLEICSGGGDWMVSRANGDDSLWAGLEIRFDRVHEMWRKVLLNRLEDRVTVIHADAADIEEIVPKGSVDEIFINFPDPPHTRWSAQRMVTSKLLKSMSNILVPGGSLVVATDDFDYIRWIAEDSKSLFKFFDTSKTSFSSSMPDYGTSYFDGLWSSRGRLERAWLTLHSLTEQQKKDVIQREGEDQGDEMMVQEEVAEKD
jgi:tRNA (guanine-N7-)-methyltransferase